MRSSAQALKDSFGIFTENINIFSLLVIISVIPQIISGVFFPLDTIFDNGVTIGSIYPLIALLVSIVVSFFTYTAIVYVAIYRLESTIGNAFDFFLHHFSALAIVSILTSLAIVLGLIALIIPGILFALWFSFSAYVVLAENKRGIEALKTSKRYVDGNIWVLIKRFVLVILITIPFTIFSLVFYIPELGIPASVIMAITTIMYTTLNFVTYLYMFETYKEFRLKYELAQSAQSNLVQNTPVISNEAA